MSNKRRVAISEQAHDRKITLRSALYNGADALNENIHKICYRLFRPLKESVICSMKDKAYEGNLGNTQSEYSSVHQQGSNIAADD